MRESATDGTAGTVTADAGDDAADRSPGVASATPPDTTAQAMSGHPAGARTPVSLSDASFPSAIAAHGRPVLVGFWSTAAAPSRLVEGAVAAVCREAAGRVTGATLDVDQHPATANQLHIFSLPTFVLFRDGREVARVVGLVPATELHARLERHL